MALALLSAQSSSLSLIVGEFTEKEAVRHCLDASKALFEISRPSLSTNSLELHQPKTLGQLADDADVQNFTSFSLRPDKNSHQSHFIVAPRFRYTFQFIC